MWWRWKEWRGWRYERRLRDLTNDVLKAHFLDPYAVWVVVESGAVIPLPYIEAIRPATVRLVRPRDGSNI